MNFLQKLRMRCFLVGVWASSILRTKGKSDLLRSPLCFYEGAGWNFSWLAPLRSSLKRDMDSRSREGVILRISPPIARQRSGEGQGKVKF